MKAIFGFLAFVFLVIFVVILVARGGNDTPNLEPVPQLAEAASSDATFKFTEAGPIIAEEDHFRVEIAVSRDQREIIVYQGYNNLVVGRQSFSNSEAAFTEFLSALDRAGFTATRNTDFETEDGLCPTRSRYVFESDQFDKEFRRWTTDCAEKGNFGGTFSTTRLLFRNQIPEFNSFISDTRRATGLRL